VVQVGAQWGAFVNTVVNLWVSWKVGTFFTSWENTAILRNRKGYFRGQYCGLQDQGFMGNWGLGEPRPLLTLIRAQVTCFSTERQKVHGSYNLKLNTGLFINNLTLSKLYCKNAGNTMKTYCISFVTDLPFYVFILVVCWAPVDLDPREMVTPGSSNR
jgi:hypothetical protein